MLSKRTTLGALALVAATLCGPARTAELGEVKVNSFIGQQLSADIELVDLTAADLADIQVRLANPNVFKGAGLSVPPVLGGLYLSVAKRDERRFLHLTTLQPVNSEALHLFLELNSGGRQVIRAATLWLTPEPPAPRIARTVATPAAAPMPALAPAPAKPVAAESSEAALSAAAERAFAARKQAAVSEPPPAPAARPVAMPAERPKARAKEPAPRAAAAKTVPEAAAPEPTQACVPAQVEQQIQQCQAMTGKLVDLEGKVQRLQQAMVAPVPVPAPAPAKVTEAAAKPAAPAKPGAKPSKPGVSAELEAKSRTRMIMMAAGGLAGLAVLGGVIYFLRKRRGQGPLKIWQSFRKKEDPEPIEPSVEEATAQG